MNDWKRWLPGLQTLSQYEAAWLRHDLMAGLVLTTMLVPVGIAYAVASGVPGIYGLYATIVAPSSNASRMKFRLSTTRSSWQGFGSSKVQVTSNNEVP
jgi:hypothetical protein